jgi:hypothetical protein
MSSFIQALEDCLDSLTKGGTDLDECLARYPGHAERLRPLLEAAVRLQAGRLVGPSTGFKARTRARLQEHMSVHPRRQGLRQAFGLAPAWQLAFSLAALALAFLASGTAFAQAALPGQPLYGWKLASEEVWRGLAPDPLAADLALAERRLGEILATSADPQAMDTALDGYRRVFLRLQRQAGPQAKALVLPLLDAHRQRLARAGISLPELDDYLVLHGWPLQPEAVPDPDNLIPIPTPDLPEILPTPFLPILPRP